MYKYANDIYNGMDVEIGSPTSRALAETWGRYQSLLSLTPLFYRGNTFGRNYDFAKYNTDSRKIVADDEKARMYKSLADALYDVDTKNLSDTKVYLGGASFRDRLTRTFKNKRLTLPAKLLGAYKTLELTLGANLRRADHYDPLSDTVALYSDNPAVLTHELGHAIDLNSWRNPANDREAKTRMGKVWKAIKGEVKSIPHDAYMLAYGATVNTHTPLGTLPARLYHESMANIRSLSAINKLKEKHPELVDTIKKLRTKTLPTAYSTYLLDAAMPKLPGIDPVKLLLGTIGGVRTVSSLASKDSFKKLQDRLQEQLKEYAASRKTKEEDPVLDDVIQNPGKYSDKQVEKIVNRNLKKSMDAYDAKYEKLKNELSKGNATSLYALADRQDFDLACQYAELEGLLDPKDNPDYKEIVDKLNKFRKKNPGINKDPVVGILDYMKKKNPDMKYNGLNPAREGLDQLKDALDVFYSNHPEIERPDGNDAVRTYFRYANENIA